MRNRSQNVNVTAKGVWRGVSWVRGSSEPDEDATATRAKTSWRSRRSCSAPTGTRARLARTSHRPRAVGARGASAAVRPRHHPHGRARGRRQTATPNAPAGTRPREHLDRRVLPASWPAGCRAVARRHQVSGASRGAGSTRGERRPQSSPVDRRTGERSGAGRRIPAAASGVVRSGSTCARDAIRC